MDRLELSLLEFEKDWKGQFKMLTCLPVDTDEWCYWHYFCLFISFITLWGGLAINLRTYPYYLIWVMPAQGREKKVRAFLLEPFFFSEGAILYL